MRPFSLAVVLATMALGCGPGSYRDLRNGLVGSTCHWAQKCGYVNPTDTADCPLDDVLTIFGDATAMRTAPGAVDVDGSISAGRMRYDSVNAGNCESAVSDAPCDPVLASRKRLSACNAVVAANTETGKVCYADMECAGGVCIRAPGCAGVCVAYAAFGTACDPQANTDGVAPIESRCDPTVGFCGAYVSGGVPVCRHKLPQGSPCTDNSQCDFGWDCRLGKCVTPIELGSGQACGGEDPCQSGKFCDPTTLLCAQQQKQGQPCVSELGCKDGLACIGLQPVAQSGTPTPVATPGTCGPWIAIGAACTSAPGAVTGCPSLSSTCTGGVCTANAHAAAVGQPCSTRSCAEGLACNGNSDCDFLVAELGSCGGARSTLCAPPLTCAATGNDEDLCTPANPPACFTMPNLDMLDVDMLESVD